MASLFESLFNKFDKFSKDFELLSMDVQRLAQDEKDKEKGDTKEGAGRQLKSIQSVTTLQKMTKLKERTKLHKDKEDATSGKEDVLPPAIESFISKRLIDIFKR